MQTLTNNSFYLRIKGKIYHKNYCTIYHIPAVLIPPEMCGNSYHSYKITAKQILASFYFYICSRTGKFRQINSTFDFFCLTTDKQQIFLCTNLLLNRWYKYWSPLALRFQVTDKYEANFVK